MALSIISAVSGVGRGVKYLSNLNLVLSLILLLTFVIFGSFLFAMTTYGTAFVDYILHFVSLSFGAYGPQSAAAFAAALPDAAEPLAADLMAVPRSLGAALMASCRPDWGAAALDEETWQPPMLPVTRVVSSAGNPLGPPSTGPGGSRSPRLSACSLPASRGVARCANSSSAASLRLRWFALHG